MNNLHVKKGDSVMIIAGKEKGKAGVITAVNIDKNTVLIDGLNLATNFVKPRSAQERGGIITKAAPINASNVMLVCADCNKPVKSGHAVVTENGKEVKIRVCKKCGASLEVKKAAKAAKKATKKAAPKKTKKAETAE